MSLADLASSRTPASSMTAELNAGTLFSLGGEDAFDKNKGNSLLGVANYVDIATDVASEISNALGYRAPMYTIGEIPAEGTEEISQWLPDSLGNVVRAIGDAISGNEQDGVIIDGIEDFSGSFKMDLPKNAMLYRSSGLTDQRVRTPCECKMKVYVSNYLSDDLLGSITNQITALDPTGLLGKVADNLLRAGGNTRAQNALYKLRSIQETGKPFRVYTPHCVYENMILKDINISTDADTMDTLVAELTFVELLMYAPNGTISKIADRKSVVKTDQQGLLRKWVGV